MDTKWMEDFIDLAETRSFSKSAIARNVTQPAFSRRIQQLEAWVGIGLIDRTSYPTKLTRAGEVFLAQALDLVARMHVARAMARGKVVAQNSEIDFAVTHSLSLTFFPKWLARIEEDFGRIRCKLNAMNVHDAAMRLADGDCDLLMCFHHPSQPVQLDPARHDMLILGQEHLHPYSACDATGQPVYRLPTSPEQRVPFLSYGDSAYLGKMVDLVLGRLGGAGWLDKIYETDMAEGLKVMTVEGHGVAFLPESSVGREVTEKAIVRTFGAQGSMWSVAMDLRLYRRRPDPMTPVRPIAQRLWAHVARSLAFSGV